MPRVRLHELRIPLVEPLETASGRVDARTSVIVADHSGDGAVGWGEAVALDGLDYPVASSSDVWDWLVAGAPAHASVPRSASGALADAALDARLRAEGTSLARHLWGDAARSSVASARVLGVEASIDVLLEAAARAVALGHRHLVLKVRPGWSVEPVRAVRLAHADVGVAVDANGSFGASDDDLDELDALGPAWIEQPVAADDLVGSTAVARRLSAPIVLDESLASAGGLDAALAAGGLDGVDVKPGRDGGVVAAAALLERAVGAGLVVLVGGLLETGIGRAAALAVAASPACALPTDLGPSARYLDPDLVPPSELDASGHLPVPDGPGLGVDVDLDRLADLEVRRRDVELGW